ncbi:MAG: TetR/AcrR family transcriptional regulator [Kofleriaceae bacterium]
MRRRLTGEEARTRIMDVALAHLRTEGVHAVTLAGLAKELDISHQAILHHFGSRDGLVAAVVKRAIDSFESELTGALRVIEGPVTASRVLLQRAFEVMADEGHGRLLAMLVLSNEPRPDATSFETSKPIAMVAKMAHALRQRDEPTAEYRDTLFTVMLTAYVVLATSVFEEAVTFGAGLEPSAKVSQEFREWFATHALGHLEKP